MPLQKEKQKGKVDSLAKEQKNPKPQLLLSLATPKLLP